VTEKRQKGLAGRFASGLWDFFVGDDWVLAIGVAVVLGVAGLISGMTGSWWVLVLGIPVVLTISLLRAVRPRR
jgi:hypothetical protein